MCVFYNLVLFYVLVYLYSVAVGASIPLLCSHRVYRNSMPSQVYTSRFFHGASVGVTSGTQWRMFSSCHL